MPDYLIKNITAADLEKMTIWFQVSDPEFEPAQRMIATKEWCSVFGPEAEHIVASAWETLQECAESAESARAPVQAPGKPPDQETPLNLEQRWAIISLALQSRYYITDGDFKSYREDGLRDKDAAFLRQIVALTRRAPDE